MIKASNLPEIGVFEELIKAPENALVKEAVAAGRIPVGYNCYITPEPLLMVGDLFPVRMRGPGLRDTVQSNYYMSLIACTYARAILESMLDGRYDFLKGIISGGSCIQIIRTAQHTDYIDKFKSRIENEGFLFYVLDSPRTVGEGAITLFINDLKRAAQKITESTGVKFTDEALREAIRKQNEYRAVLKRISDFRKGPNPKITGTEYHNVVVAFHTTPKDLLVKPMEELIAALEKREPVTGYKGRVMITGPIFDNPLYTKLIEDQDVLVVADRYCYGSLPGIEPIPEDGDPWETLAKYYADTCECTRMMGWNERRFGQLMDYVKEFSVDGVIMQYLKFCDLFAYEVPTTQKMFREKGIPVVRFEHEYGYSNEGQIKTRIQAFVEQMENQMLVQG
ncbi:MAG: 2-hydroxyacyl-CoA dehydratase family protein [Lachnospiraceae bacterium]|jgi:benzoyl-CoA reductase/2-hydroxyglutaryl-CoA dehydratase subunit BcrC/BadD/HgdB|nr:2-hydroxyacyl-CoA dehydratase family protein [Lachnospiraceae bacterium]